MSLKDILSVLPKYYDNSGYDVVVTFGKSTNYKFIEDLTPEQLNKTVISIEQGLLLIGGDKTDQLHITIKE